MKKLALILLALVLLVPLLVACGGEDESSIASEASTTSVDEEVEVRDMHEREFQILCHDFGYNSNSILGFTGEVLIKDEENMSSVDEAKKRVIDNIEAAYNCTISGDIITDAVCNVVKTQITSGLPYYEICFDSMGNAATLAVEKLLLDLNEIPTIDLSKSWWDQNAVKDLSLGGKVFFTCGDINTYDDQGTWCILFNKVLKDKLGISEDFYQMAKDGSWTFDELVRICRDYNVTQNNNGDSVLDEKDQWAFGGETYNIYVHCVAAGIPISEKDEEDLPILTYNSDREATFQVLSEVLDFYTDNSVTMIANYKPYTEKGFSNVWEATTHKAFIEGRELFYMCGLINVASFRKMDDEFGILPVPKHYDTQDRYYHTVSCGNCTMMYLPIDVVDPDEVGLIVSALSKESKKYVTPAYYDVQLKYRDAKDEESAEILDIIFSTRMFDIANAYNWGEIRSLYTSMEKDTIASRFEANIGVAQAKLDEMLEDLDW